MTYSTTARGHAYELQTIDILRAQGFTVRHLSDEIYHASDLELATDREGLLVEVKGATAGRINKHSRGYKFVLEKTRTNAAPTEPVIILACQTEKGTELYVIPRELIDSKYVTITSVDLDKYRGKYHVYRGAYSLLEEMGAKRKLPN